MLGLILSLLFIAYKVVVGGVACNTAVASCLPWLWTWHLVWTLVFGVFVTLMFLVGLGSMCVKGGGGMGALLTFIIVPMMAVRVVIGQTLFLGAVAIAMRANMTAPTPNTTYLIIAGIMYLVGIIMQRSNGASAVSTASKAKS